MRGFKVDALPERYQRQIKRQIDSQNRAPGALAHVEPALGNALVQKEKAKGYNGQVTISVLEKRHRLPDFDGSSFKYCLDSIVSAGILRDDSRKFVTGIQRKTVKVDKEKTEETIIEIYAIGE